jgi:D-cysteine desulfhydrase
LGRLKQGSLIHLARFPRRRYTAGFTPIEPLPRLTAALGGPEIWIKRDDLLGLAGGGNKTRKLEFLVAEALAAGADTLITVGAVQSNHCRLTLAAAAREGLKCRLLLEERVPGSYRQEAVGNNLLFDLLGAERIEVVGPGEDLAARLQQIAEEVRAQGGRPYVIPGGGSNPTGALGYVACAEELLAQTFDLGLALDAVVCASGSAGTHSGLLVGLQAADAQIPLVGINVRRSRAEQEGNVHRLATETAALLGARASVPREAVTAYDDWVGPGYSLPTEEMVEAVRMFARLEGVLLDPVYTGKAAAGLIGLVRRGDFARRQRVLFLHTGGAPVLHAYRDVLADGAGRA